MQGGGFCASVTACIPRKNRIESGGKIRTIWARASNMGELVKYEKGDSFSTITLDDGRANVMSVAMLKAINGALDQAETDRKIVLMTGRAKIFSGGFDLATFKEGKQALFDMLKAGAETSERMLSFPFPIVIACNGHAIAMGVFILLAGDVRIGVDSGAKIQANEVEIGLTLPRFAVEMCRQRLTPAHFSLAANLSEPYTPERALAAGFLDEIAPAAELMARAQEKAKGLNRLNMGAHNATKARVRAQAMKLMEEAIEADVAEWKTQFT